MKFQKANIFLLLAFFVDFAIAQSTNNDSNLAPSTSIHEKILGSIGIVFLIISSVIYYFDQAEEKIVEFTVFNSQYIGKDSTRSNSEHDFPNFDVEAMRNSNDHGEDEEKSSQRRRRKRKVDKITKKQQSQGGLDVTPPIRL